MTTCFAVLPVRCLFRFDAPTRPPFASRMARLYKLDFLYTSYVHALTNKDRKLMYLSKSTIQNYEYASRDVHVPQKVGCGAGQG
jgi:hypothetical protein